MRINVYAEELTPDVQIITKQVVPAGGDKPVTFYGVRFYLKSHDDLHHGPDDDDRSAITLWVPWTRARGNDVAVLDTLIGELEDRLFFIGQKIAHDNADRGESCADRRGQSDWPDLICTLREGHNGAHAFVDATGETVARWAH